MQDSGEREGGAALQPVSDSEPHERLIRALELVGPLSEQDRDALRTGLKGTVRRYRSHQDIVSEGQRPDAICIVLTGLCCRQKVLPDGTRQILSFHIPGDVPDAQSLFLRTMDHSLSTLGDVSALHVPHQTVFELFDRAPGLERLFWHWTLIEASIFREWITNVGRRAAYNRIAHVLCEIVCRLKGVGLSDGVTCELPVTQSDLADATGISTVHVNRSLQALRRQNLIAFKAGMLTILDWDGLCKAGDFDAGYLHLPR